MPNKSEMSGFDESKIDQKNDSVEVADFNDNENIDDELIIEEDMVKTSTKNEQAKELMKSSAQLISEADSAVEITKKSVSENVNKFEDAKKSLLNTTLTQSQDLLERASYEYSKQELDDPFEVSLGTIDENIKVGNISSGGFSGFILALLAALGVVGAWIYVASTELGVALTPEIINNEAEQTSIFKWIGGITGADVDPILGMVTVGVTALLIAWIIYKLRVSMKENKNFRVANETFEKSNIYVEHQQEAKTEMQRIDEHIVEIIPVIENYRVLLNEQNAKLERVLHIEGIKEDNSEYHSSSVENMRESERLIQRVEELVTTPITKDGQLNEASVTALIEAKSVSDYFVSKLYV
ncbi:hypothetical protein GSY74_00265 [Sulfurovum sp. bin170]|uniref:hypothetical protein n=1 Tax=Sulfurovum sp. bin170 TaxID=2695268 RepID=UPI0013E0D091|nr:hypothetical protein [Sulfurovum sp. bin170]NEW59704.1 hypothetical protein [Sulfurovum sp. bin170]